MASATAGCGGSSSIEPSVGDVVLAPGARDEATLSGAGSTAVAPLLQDWVEQYRRIAPGVNTRYQLSGSDAGTKALTTGDVDFAFSDTPLSPTNKIVAGGDHVVQIPLIGLGVAIVYNLPGVEKLRFRPDVLAGVLQGTISQWDDASIKADNPSLRLPPTAITVVHRIERSGTTAILTRYLQQAAPRTWTLGFSSQVAWPRGVEARGSEGMIRAMQQKTGTIGYAALAFPLGAGLPVAEISNRSDRFVGPTPETIAAALSAAEGNDEDLTLEVPLTDAPRGYPISGFSYLVLRIPGSDPAKADALRHFAAWALTEGQRAVERLNYAPVPLALAARSLEGLAAGGAPVSRE